MNALSRIAAFSSGLSSDINFSTASRSGIKQAADQRQGESATTTQTASVELRQLNAEIQRLSSRDRAVRAHELAHSTVGGQYAGAARLTYQRGPDGVLYATGGEVPIDVAIIPGDPQATIEKMRVVRNAALAPLNPSATDRAIASQASARAAKASAELAKLAAEQRQTKGTAVDVLV